MAATFEWQHNRQDQVCVAATGGKIWQDSGEASMVTMVRGTVAAALAVWPHG